MISFGHALQASDSRQPLDVDTRRAASAFLQRLEEKYEPLDALIYGSRARGTHHSGSDADIAVILKGSRGDRYAVGGQMADIAFDVLRDTGILIQALPIWEAELKRPKLFHNPALIENIKRDGLRLRAIP